MGSLAPATRRIYAQALLALESFANDNFQGVWFPTPVATLAIHISNMLNEGKAVSTALTTLSAVAFFHKLFDFNDPAAHFFIKRIISGASKVSRAVDTRTPITLHILQCLIESCSHVTPSAYHACMLKAMYLTMFHAFLRIGEVTQSPNALMFADVILVSDAFTITFRKFKHHKGPPVSINVPAANSPLCAVLALHQYVAIRGGAPGPLFAFPDATPISPRLFSTYLSSSLAWCDLGGANIKPHSFRIGAATFAAARGYTSCQIKKMGRWNSNAFEKYIRINTFATF
jgi:hypothetical protein